MIITHQQDGVESMSGIEARENIVEPKSLASALSVAADVIGLSWGKR